MTESERGDSKIETVIRRVIAVALLATGGYFLYLVENDNGEIRTVVVDNNEQFNPPQGGQQIPQGGNGIAVSPTATRPVTAEDIQRAGEFPQSIIDYAGGAEYIQTFSNKNELLNYLRSIYSRPDDQKYEGIYFFAGDLHSVPEIDEGTVTHYDPIKYQGKYTGFAVPFNDNEPTCASWKYPGGTILRITNKITGAEGYCVVNDRGPNRLYRGNQDYRRYLADLTTSLFRQIDPTMSGEIEVVIEPVGFISYWIQAHPEYPPSVSNIPSWALSTRDKHSTQNSLKISQNVFDKLDSVS